MQKEESDLQLEIEVPSSTIRVIELTAQTPLNNWVIVEVKYVRGVTKKSGLAFDCLSLLVE